MTVTWVPRKEAANATGCSFGCLRQSAKRGEVRTKPLHEGRKSKHVLYCLEDCQCIGLLLKGEDGFLRKTELVKRFETNDYQVSVTLKKHQNIRRSGEGVHVRYCLEDFEKVFVPPIKVIKVQRRQGCDLEKVFNDYVRKKNEG